MTYRIICDEHVEQQTVEYLRREGHEAVHVEGTLGLSTDDTEIGAYARENGHAVMTNDDDFLNDTKFPEITVLYYTDNERRAHELATMIAELTTYYPTQCDLPRIVFLTETDS
jgi:rRNA-processing protein FCF1